MPKFNPELKAEFVAQRRYIQNQNRRLSEKGLPTLEVPKLKELNNETALKAQIRRIEQFREQGRATIKGARAYEEARKERKREQQRERRRKEREFRRILNKKEKNMVDHLKKNYGIKIDNKDELNKWFDYLKKRQAMQSRKEYYRFDVYVDEFQEMKEKGMLQEPNFSEMMKDFNAFLSDENQLRERMTDMNMRYDKGFIDQLYSDYLERQIERDEKR